MNYHISNLYFSYVMKALICLLLFKISNAAPINSSVTYANFLKEIKHDNCVFPKYIAFPFNSSDIFEFLEFHIKICSPSEEMKVKRSREAVNLCSDIFNILKNITCHPDSKVQLPEIKVDFSKNVCGDISSLQFSPDSKTLLKHLTDRYVCEMMCDDEFNPACQVLLWGYQVQQQINNAAVVLPKGKEQKLEINQQKVETNNDNPESENVADVQNEAVADTANKDEDNSGNEDNSQINVPSDKKVSTVEVLKQSSSPLAPSNNDTTPAEDNKAKIQPVPLIEKSKSENAEGKPVIDVNKIENQENSQLLDKEKETSPPISSLDIKTNKDNAFVKVDELPVAQNEIKTDNEEKASSPTKNKQPDVSDQKPVPSKAGLVEEVKSPGPNVIQSGKTAETAKSSNKSETKVKAQTTVIETTKDGITAPETKDLSVMPDETKTKDIKITTLKTEEQKVKETVEDADKNAVPESVTKETSEDASPITIAADLEKMEDGIEMPVPSDKNQEPYNDMENGGDYSKLDYDDADDGFYESSKNIKTGVVKDSKMPVVESQNDLPKYENYQPRNSIGHGAEDIQVIPAFPEQEDSHFFFYFLSIVLILMGGYLLFHNKQKIIALIVEGRHERRRRSHGVGYKKLETK